MELGQALYRKGDRQLEMPIILIRNVFCTLSKAAWCVSLYTCEGQRGPVFCHTTWTSVLPRYRQRSTQTQLRRIDSLLWYSRLRKRLCKRHYLSVSTRCATSCSVLLAIWYMLPAGDMRQAHHYPGTCPGPQHRCGTPLRLLGWLEEPKNHLVLW